MAYDNFTNSFLFAKNQEKEAMLKALPLLQTDDQIQVLPGQEACKKTCP